MGRNICRGILLYLALGLSSSESLRAARDEEFNLALSQARSLNHLLALVLLGEEGPDEAWIREQLRRPEWRRSLEPHTQLILRADRNPSLVSRFGATTFPQLILLDGEGREVGRLHGKEPVETLARKLQSIIKAVERFQESDSKLKEDPLDPNALFWIGKYRWNRGDRSVAVECFQRAMARSLENQSALDPELRATALRHIAQHSLDHEDYAAAEASFREAFAASQDEENLGHSALGLAVSLWRLGRAAEALSVLEKCQASHPESPVADQVLFTLGYVNHQLGQRAAALRYFHLLGERYPQSLYGQRAKRYLGPAPTFALKS
jgi:TolA-binding protein